MDVELTVDGEKIGLNEFATKIFAGIIAGAASSLRGMKEDWREIEIKVTK